MSKKVALITLHGMGKYKSNYQQDLVGKLRGQIGSKVFDENVCISPVQYQGVMEDGTLVSGMQKQENDIWLSMNNAHDLDGSALRKFLLFGFGDAGAMEYSYHGDDKTLYLDVQQAVYRAFEAALVALGNDASKPVLIIAQSLGCQVLSNYFWDAQKGIGIFDAANPRNLPITDFHKGRTCRFLLTTGCNIPLFVAGLPKIKCFTNPALFFNQAQDNFIWHNYFDVDDVLGWPLKQLGEFKNTVTHDIEINSGNVFSNWNIASHSKYWVDKNVYVPLAERLSDFI